MRFLFVRLSAFLLVFCLSAGPSFAEANKKTISASSANAGVSESMLGTSSGATYTLSVAGEKPSFATNDITISYTTNNLTTTAPLALDSNTLTIKDNTQSFTGDQAAARVTLTNTGTHNTVDNTGFNLSLTNNRLDLNTTVTASNGGLYGALFSATNSGIGAGIIDGNIVALDSSAKLENNTPSLVGGAAEMMISTRGVSSAATVSNNSVTVNVPENRVINSDITGGYVSLSINQTNGSKTYNVTPTVDGNTVSLTNGKFTGNTIIGGEASLLTNEKYEVTFQGTVQNNAISMTDSKVEGALVIGGRATINGAGVKNASTVPFTVDNNTITISGGTIKDTLLIAGVATSPYDTKDIVGTVTNNTIDISNSPTFSGKTILVGGYASGDSSTLSNNKLVLHSKDISVYGVDGFNTYQFDVSGAAAGDSFLTVAHGDGHSHEFFAPYEKNPKNHALNLDGATIDWQTLGGRPTSLNVSDSITLISETSGMGITGTVSGLGTQTDIVDGTETYSYKLIQDGNNIQLLHNGLASSGNWNQAINLTAGSVAGSDVFTNIGGTLTAPSIVVTGSSAATASLTANALDVSSQNTTLTLNNTTGDQVKFETITVSGGNTLTKNGNGFYSFGNMTIDGAGSNVTGLDAMRATNTVTLSGGATPTFDQINLGNGSALTISGGTYDFNTLNVYGNGDTFTGDLNAANKNLNFYLADTTAAGDTVLNVTGNADITGSTVKVGIPGTDSALSKDDQLVLLKASSDITGAPTNLKGVGMQGFLLNYDFDLSIAGAQLLATVTRAGFTEESKAFLEGRAAALAALSQGGEFVAFNALNSAIYAATAREDEAMALFTAFGGGKTRYETGSHVDVTGGNAVVGLSHNVSIFSAEFVLASFLEYGNGSYNTHNDFSSGRLKGSGNTDYFGLGAMGRWVSRNNTYIDGSLRVGKVSTDFKADLFGDGQKATYDYNTLYYGGHFGLGYLYDEIDDMQLDLYAKYLATGQEGKKITISSGENLRFKESISSRVRAGLKANFFNVETVRPYLGAAYEYEFSGKANATAYHMKWDAPSLKGSSGVGEAGLTWVRDSWAFTLGAEGYVGQRQGVTGTLQIGYEF